jgi:hypothetical protein
MPRYKLRTLLILLAVVPPMLACFWLFPTRAALVLSGIGFVVAVVPVTILLWRDSIVGRH